MNTRVKVNSWMDVLLLGGVVLAAAGACGVLALMTWQAPQIARASNHPTAALLAAPPAPAPTYTAAAMPTEAPSATAVPSPTPTATGAPRQAATVTLAPSPTTAPSAGLGGKWIDIDISEQTLTAYQGESLLLRTSVSTGMPNTPTPLGEFAIYSRVPIQDMGGPGYWLRNVQYVAYFEKDYALHATYWHDNFGQPMSHGCVNLRTADAQWLYEWAPLGTPVRVHD